MPLKEHEISQLNILADYRDVAPKRIINALVKSVQSPQRKVALTSDPLTVTVYRTLKGMRPEVREIAYYVLTDRTSRKLDADALGEVQHVGLIVKEARKNAVSFLAKRRMRKKAI